MEPSECCIFRIVVASLVGAGVGVALLAKHSLILAVLIAPIGGSLMAVAAMLVFQSFRPFVSKEPIGLDPNSDYFVRKIKFL